MGRGNNIGKTKKRRGQINVKRVRNKKMKVESTEQNDYSSEFFKEYISLMREDVQLDHKVIVGGKTKKMDSKLKDKIKKQRHPKLVETVLLSCQVWDCPIMTYIVRRGHNNGSKYKKKEDKQMMIRVNMSNLEDTMIPFGNQLSDDSKRVGKVVKSYDYRSEQQWLMEHRVESYGTSVYYRHNQMYYRLGDYLSHSEIVNCIAESLPTANFVYYWLWCCHHKHLYAEIMHFKLIRNKRTTNTRATGDELSLEIAADEASDFCKMIVKAVEMVGSPKHILRTGWMNWNICDRSYDTIRGKNELEFVERQRTNLAKFWTLDEESAEFHSKLNKLAEYHLLCIMSTSQSAKDEILKKQYHELFEGRLSPSEMLQPLRRMPFERYFQHLFRGIKTSSLQSNKAETILIMSAIIQCRFGGFMPLNANMLMAIPHIGKKKAAVTLNSLGIYDSTGIGPGADVHVIRLFSYFVEQMGVNSTDTNVTKMCKHIPANPGVDAK